MDPGTAALTTLSTVLAVSGYGASKMLGKQQGALDNAVTQAVEKTKAEIAAQQQRTRAAEMKADKLQKLVDSLTAENEKVTAQKDKNTEHETLFKGASFSAIKNLSEQLLARPEVTGALEGSLNRGGVESMLKTLRGYRYSNSLTRGTLAKFFEKITAVNGGKPLMDRQMFMDIVVEILRQEAMKPVLNEPAPDPTVVEPPIPTPPPEDVTPTPAAPLEDVTPTPAAPLEDVTPTPAAPLEDAAAPASLPPPRPGRPERWWRRTTPAKQRTRNSVPVDEYVPPPSFAEESSAEKSTRDADCVRKLSENGITDKKSFNAWRRTHHPDKGGNNQALYQEMEECWLRLHPKGGMRKKKLRTRRSVKQNVRRTRRS